MKYVAAVPVVFMLFVLDVLELPLIAFLFFMDDRDKGWPRSAGFAERVWCL